jgi:hypothetical protein
MSLRIRRGTDAQRTGKTFDPGEIVWTTDNQQLWVGTGVTAGGVPVVGSNVAGYGIVYNNITKKLDVSGLTSDDVVQGVNNKYFSTELAVDAVGAALVAGNATNVGITFTYATTQDDAGRINATVDASAFIDTGLLTVQADTTPELGGNLDLNSKDINGTGNINITGSVTADSGTIDDFDATTANIGTINTSVSLLTDNILPYDDVNNIVRFGSNTVATTVMIRGDGQQTTIDLRANTSNGTGPQPIIKFGAIRGTQLTPSVVQDNDILGSIIFSGYTGQSNQDGFGTGFVMGVRVTDTGVLTNEETFDGTLIAGTVADVVGGTFVNIAPGGILSAPIFKAKGYATGSLPSSPAEGYIVFDSTTKEFKGWNGTAWAVLG